MEKEKWLSCAIGPGQFSEELAISGDTFDGQGFSLFVPENFVQRDGGTDEHGKSTGWVRVVEIDREGELVLVRLPRQTLGNGSTITVSANELEENASRQEA